MPIPPDKPTSFMHFTAEKELLDAIDEWRWKYRLDRRSYAIKWLLNWALKHDPIHEDLGKAAKAKTTAKPRKKA
jgi:hypothetical protein